MNFEMDDRGIQGPPSHCPDCDSMEITWDAKTGKSKCRTCNWPGASTIKSRCVQCGAELKWGGFAHNQDTCFDCFKGTVTDVLTRLTGKERDAVVWMMALTAERFGYEW